MPQNYLFCHFRLDQLFVVQGEHGFRVNLLHHVTILVEFSLICEDDEDEVSARAQFK